MNSLVPSLLLVGLSSACSVASGSSGAPPVAAGPVSAPSVPRDPSAAGAASDAGELPYEARTPVTPAELEALEAACLFTADDVRHLRLSRAVLEPRVDELLDTWYGFIASRPELVATFASRATGEPVGSYLDAVRVRFRAWVLATADAEFDREWLAHQHEIGLRHSSYAKNATDGVDSVERVPFRYLIPLVWPVTATLRPFLASGGHDAETVDAMHAAWTKAVLLQVTLWSRPYVRDGEY